MDNASSCGNVFDKKTKDQWLPLLIQFITQFEREHALTVKVIRGDGEFETKKMRMWASEHGVRMQFTETDESSSNGKAERHHRIIFNGMRAVMVDLQVLQEHCGLPH